MTRLPPFKKRRLSGGCPESNQTFLDHNFYLAVDLLERHGRIKTAPTTADITQFFEHAATAALTLVEQKARHILRTNQVLDEFIMGMGSCYFTVKNNPKHTLSPFDRHYMKSLAALLSEWTPYLKLTGTPMRFTADGPKITDW